jgi:hypothetical protein
MHSNDKHEQRPHVDIPAPIPRLYSCPESAQHNTHITACVTRRKLNGTSIAQANALLQCHKSRGP